MGFRDDREASAQRIELLEREMAGLRTELDAATLRAAEVDDLRKRLSELGDEKAALHRGVAPEWERRNQRLRSWVFVLGGALAVGGFLAYHGYTRRVSDDEHLMARGEADLGTCEGELRQCTTDRDVAQHELGRIDDAHRGEVEGLEHQLLAARRSSGPTLIVGARVDSQTGFHPPGLGHDCLLTVRALGRGFCDAQVVCGAARVFPYNEPAPDVECNAVDGAPWTPEADLGRLHAGILSTPEPLLEYDPRGRTITVRETGTPQFTLHLRVDDVPPTVVR